MKYTKWTEGLEQQAQFLLAAYRDYDVVADYLGISVEILENRNNKYWKINCRKKWDDYSDTMLLMKLQEGLSKKEISVFFDTTENAIDIRLSKINRRK